MAERGNKSGLGIKKQKKEGQTHAPITKRKKKSTMLKEKGQGRKRGDLRVAPRPWENAGGPKGTY